MIDGLSGYLQKFRVLLGDKAEEKRVVIEALRNLCSVEIPAEKISLSKNIVTLALTPLERSEVTLHKKEIILYCKEKGIIIAELR